MPDHARHSQTAWYLIALWRSETCDLGPSLPGIEEFAKPLGSRILAKNIFLALLPDSNLIQLHLRSLFETL